MKWKYEFKYLPILKNLFIIILSSAIMGILAYFMQLFISISPDRVMKVVQCGIIGLISFSVYALVTFITGTMKDILGEDFLNKFKLRKNS